MAENFGFTSEVIAGKKFKHQMFRKQGRKQGQGKLLHVYIEGDGRPWHSRQRVSLDPTPKNPLMLKLMATDPAPSVYLGRPCYFNLHDANCSPIWWTHKRYSEVVVSSLDNALQRYATDYDGIILFGHSGGGTLAMLLAAMRTDVVALITLAGNLDIDAWARHHRYSSLHGSINPAKQAPLSKTTLQQHYLGERDDNIKPDMIRTTIEQQYAAQFFLLKEIDHSCCWQTLWPDLLNKLERELAKQRRDG
ncbi:MAG: alpha/beta hydrolase [Pseudomonadales bacterium]